MVKIVITKKLVCSCCVNNGQVHVQTPLRKEKTRHLEKKVVQEKGIPTKEDFTKENGKTNNESNHASGSL